MTNIDDKVFELRKAIENTDEYKRYIVEKTLLESNSEIAELRKLIVRAQNENRLDDYNLLLKRYSSHPLVVNFNNSKEDLMELFNTIKSLIE